MPDPFSIPGMHGECHNGGWMPVPDSTPAPTPTPTPTPSPTPSPAPPPPNTACGADPFAGIPGLVGMCVNGGWIPAPGVRMTGSVHRVQGVWTIAGDDQMTYTPANLPVAFQIDALRVSFVGAFTFDPSVANGVTIITIVGF